MSDAYSALWVMLMLVTPGVPAGWLIARSLGWGLPSVVVLSFTCSSAAAAVVLLLAQLVPMSLPVAVVLSVLVLVAGTTGAIALFRRRGAGRLDVDAFGLGMIGAAAVIALLERPWLAKNVDAFFHIAAARSLLFFDDPVVHDAFYGVGSDLVDPSSGVFHSVLGLASWVRGFDPAFLYAGFNVVSAAVLASAAWALVKALGARPVPAALTAGALTFLNTFSDFRFIGYPNRLGITILMLAAAALASAVGARRGAAFAAVLASLVTASAHTGLALAIVALAAVVTAGMTAWGFFERRDQGSWDTEMLRRLWFTSVAMVAAAVLANVPKLWVVLSGHIVGSPLPDYSSNTTVSSLFVAFGRGWFFYPETGFKGGNVMMLLGTALAMMCVVVAVRRRDRLMAVSGFIGLLPFVLGFNPVFTPVLLAISPYTTWRALDLFTWSPYVSIPRGWEVSGALSKVALVGALLVTAPALSVLFLGSPPVVVRPGVANVSIVEGWKRDVRELAGPGTIGGIAAVFADEWPVIAADEQTGYFIGGLTRAHPIAVTAVHAPVFMEDAEGGEKRRADMVRFFDPDSSQRERRAILDDYGATYALLWPGNTDPLTRKAMLADRGHFTVAYEYRGITLLAYEP